MRYLAFIFVLIAAVACAVLGVLVSPYCHFGLIVFGPLALLGIWDVVQVKHSITRNYPIIAHLRFIQEDIAPEIHQYFIESNTKAIRTLLGKRIRHQVRKVPYLSFFKDETLDEVFRLEKIFKDLDEKKKPDTDSDNKS